MRRVFLVIFIAFLLDPLSAGASPRVGQWIWSRTDLSLYESRLKQEPGLEAGLFVATVAYENGRAVLRRALSPALTDGAPAAVVIRFDDSFHAFWKEKDQVLAESANRLLAGLLRNVAATGASPREIQLDYDCPERLLARWAGLLRSLREGALKGREVWITSLPVHLGHRDFGTLFEGAVAGHIPQVFDTGLRFSPDAARDLRERLDRARLPFRLGLGAFERTTDARASTHHGAWWKAVDEFEKSPLYQGLWIFPAGQPWRLL